jgi:phosphonopyruvate decarboxylase
MLSRELFEFRVKRGDGHERDFLTVGGMGHASSIALGIALQKPNRTVSVFFLFRIAPTSFFFEGLLFGR